MEPGVLPKFMERVRLQVQRQVATSAKWVLGFSGRHFIYVRSFGHGNDIFYEKSGEKRQLLQTRTNPKCGGIFGYFGQRSSPRQFHG